MKSGRLKSGRLKPGPINGPLALHGIALAGLGKARRCITPLRDWLVTRPSVPRY
jgi:hypothetical protein